MDDEPLLLRTAARILSFLGYPVLRAHSGEAALALVAGAVDTVGLLVTDVGLPGMDGCALATELWARAPELRVLFITGRTDLEIVRYGVAVDPRAAVLAKPFTRGELVAAVRGLLGPAA